MESPVASRNPLRPPRSAVSSPTYAHTHPSFPNDLSQWEPLFTPFGPDTHQCQRDTCVQCEALAPNHGHLNKVAFWTARFAGEMFSPGPDRDSAHQWGYLAGLWHDLGKFSDAFQNRLKGHSASVDHSTAGAQFIFDRLPVAGQLFAYLIAGHHAGLADWSKNGDRSDLTKRLSNHGVPDWRTQAPAELLDFIHPPPLAFLNVKKPASIACFTRFLFSCLVDADFLATEAFMNASEHKRRPQWPADITARMQETEARYFQHKFGKSGNDVVSQNRASVRNDCIDAAEKSSGIFTLTVPTGGGKTLSSLAFALKHAVLHKLRRIVYVIPYTSIIEQNAQVFRDALQELAAALPQELRPSLVLEHHSNFDPPELQDSMPVWKLASENWDAPLIVTTSVQFFESLHANKTSRCRKLHNLARSVIILDEAQNLPVDLLAPSLDSIRNLVGFGGASVILCTATQPAVGRRPERDDPFNKIALDIPSDGSREIIRDVPALFTAFERVKISNAGDLSNEDLASRLRSYQRVLCILNTKRHAVKVFEALGGGDPANIHLSAQLCPAHRQTVLAEIRRREQCDEPCRVISTTVVEAGVDLDFPAVFRALTGLDSLAQAAGRCNRHGKGGRDGGSVILFTPADEKCPVFLTQNVNAIRNVLPDFDSQQLLGPKAMNSFFQSYFWLSGGPSGRGWDRHEINGCFTCDTSEARHPFTFNFKTAANAFQLIPDTQAPVIIEPREGLWIGQDETASAKVRQMMDEIRNSHQRKYPPPANCHRALQRYTVQIPKNVQTAMVAAGLIQIYHDRFPILTHPQNDYDAKLGLLIPGHLDKPGSFMI